VQLAVCDQAWCVRVQRGASTCLLWNTLQKGAEGRDRRLCSACAIVGCPMGSVLGVAKQGSQGAGLCCRKESGGPLSCRTCQRVRGQPRADVSATTSLGEED
jgi:hypothetical protein